MFNIIGIGEILWDLLPGGKRLGGAPANFAYVANALGNRGMVLSRVGTDAAGKEILGELKAKNLSTGGIQLDDRQPTGAAKVTLRDGEPSYEILENAAWDHMELSDDWRAAAREAHAICFGSLAQRGEVSAQAIRLAVQLTRKLRIFDVNLRQPFYTPKILRKSLFLATVVKLSSEELPAFAGMFEVKERDPIKIARYFLYQYGLKMFCITRGAKGSFLVTKKHVSNHPGIKIELADAVGAGDAFTAALAHGLLRRWELNKINDFANRVGAFVASKEGAMPELPEEFKE